MHFKVKPLQNPNLYGKNHVAITEQDQEALGISKGDYVEAEADSFNDQILRVATLDPEAISEDERALQMGPRARHMLEVKTDETVNVERISLEPADNIDILVPEVDDISRPIEEIVENEIVSRGFKRLTFSSFLIDSTKPEPRIIDGFISGISPNKAALVTKGTEISVEARKDLVEDAHNLVTDRTIDENRDMFDADEVINQDVSASYEDIGGLSEELARLEETVGLPLRFPEIFNRLGISPPQGVLLHGPPGTGKTLLARAVAAEADANFVSLSGPAVIGSGSTSAAEKLQKIFERAQEDTPSILFIDEIDAFARDRDDLMGQGTREAITQLLTLMDGLEDRGDIVVIAATNRPDDLDGALRRGGRFTREIEVGIPNTDDRLEILKIHTFNTSLDDDVDLQALAEATHGYVGADLESLVKEAGMASVRRVAPHIDFERDSIENHVLNELKICQQDFKDALIETSPSGMRDVAVESPNVSWDDVGGQKAAKHKLKKVVEWPLEYGDGYDYLDIDSTTGIVLHGPPGTGKTLLAKAVANETDANFLSVKSSELITKWVGESAQNVGELFDKARRNAPAILCIDEIDSILPNRGSVSDSGAGQERSQTISQFLSELDGLKSLEDVVVIGTTNRIDAMDPAILRGGRLEEHVRVDTPDCQGRKEIIEIHASPKPVDDTVDYSEIAEKTEGFTGADLERLCSTAAEIVLENVIANHPDDEFTTTLKSSAIKNEHFIQALKQLKANDDIPSGSR